MIQDPTLTIACPMSCPPTYVTFQGMLTRANGPTTDATNYIGICHDGLRL